MFAAGVRCAMVRNTRAKRWRSVSDASSLRTNQLQSSSAQRRSSESMAAVACERTVSRPPNPAMSRLQRSAGGSGNRFDSSPSKKPNRPIWIWRVWCSATP